MVSYSAMRRIFLEDGESILESFEPNNSHII